MREETEQPVEKLRRDISGALDVIDDQLSRLEILTAAMAAFSQPIPDYDPGFQHQRHLTASATTFRQPR